MCVCSVTQVYGFDCRGHCAVLEVGRADVRESGDANSPSGSEKGPVRSPGTGSQYSLHPLCVSQGLLDKKEEKPETPLQTWPPGWLTLQRALEKATSQKTF